MKYTSILLFSIMLGACQSDSVYKYHTFKLQDKSGDIWAEVSCILPVTFDTIYISKNTQSKCEPIEHLAHSKKQSKLELFNIWDGKYIDSLYYFSIAHSSYSSCDTAWLDRRRNHKEFENYLNKKHESNDCEMHIDSTFQANGQTYTVLSYLDKIGQTSFYEVGLHTIFNNRILSIHLRNNASSKTVFYRQAHKILKSLKIKAI